MSGYLRKMEFRGNKRVRAGRLADPLLYFKLRDKSSMDAATGNGRTRSCYCFSARTGRGTVRNAIWRSPLRSWLHGVSKWRLPMPRTLWQ
ncbi:hypothetical protein AVEN_205454-1 [Araneus ventricosus]|uniref:Uncharacterized protein n=1 Tax=Araneus ventricosus TaxID=182803 RepID=A0A4Y2CDG9_ARAVE|nr:hypothetical protein AVEN_205454-1 [Araneus ventricosus]